MRHAVAAIGLVLIAGSAAAQEARVGDPSCAPVTLVTIPWSVMRVAGLAPLHAPATVRLCPGTHTATFAQPGYESLTATITIPDASPAHFAYDLVPLEADEVAWNDVGVAADERVNAAIVAYLEDGDARRAAADLEAALASGTLARSDSVRAGFYLSLARHALGDVTRAREAVRLVTRIAPCLTPAETLAPPALRLLYPGSTIATCRLGPARSAVASALLPGLGQALQGDRHRGFVIGGTFALAFGSGAVLLIDSNTYYDQYLEAQSPPRVSELYDKAAWRRRAGIGLLTGATALYAWNVWEAWRMGGANLTAARPYFEYAGGEAVHVGFSVAVGR